MFEQKGNKIWSMIGLVIFVVVFYFLAKHLSLITGILNKSGPWAPLVALLLYPISVVTPISTEPITMVVGATYGPLMGVLIAWTGNMMAAMEEYFIGSKISKSASQDEKRRMPFGLEKMPVNSIPFLIFGRMIPGYGSTITSLLAAVYKVPLKRYLWTSAVTALLGSIVLSFGGSGLINLIKGIF